MILHHFTSKQHLPLIQESGLLMPSDSNFTAPWQASNGPGPEVVWLLDTDVLDFDHGLNGSGVDKTEVRITVDVPGIRWLDWLWTSRMDPDWRKALIMSGGGEEAAAHWYIFPSPIRKSRWVSTYIRDN